MLLEKYVQLLYLSQINHILRNRKGCNSFCRLPDLLLAGNGGGTVTILGTIATKLGVTAALKNDFCGVSGEVCPILFVGLSVHHSILRAIDGEYPQGRLGEILGGVCSQ